MPIGFRLVICSLPFLLLAYVIGLTLIGAEDRGAPRRAVAAWAAVSVGFGLSAIGLFIWAVTA